jgi:hypothetical protein
MWAGAEKKRSCFSQMLARFHREDKMDTSRFDDIEKLTSKVGEEFSVWSSPI